MQEDNWKHRAANMTCNTCMWFVPKATKTLAPNSTVLEVESEIGRCRRHAPTMNGFPVVFKSDWCGDHKLDETKL